MSDVSVAFGTIAPLGSQVVSLLYGVWGHRVVCCMAFGVTELFRCYIVFWVKKLFRCYIVFGVTELFRCCTTFGVTELFGCCMVVMRNEPTPRYIP